MKIKYQVLSTLIVCLTLATVQAAERHDVVAQKGKTLTRYITQFYGSKIKQQPGVSSYVGSEMCLACHTGPAAPHEGFDTSGWRGSFHSRPFKAVPDDRFSMVTGKGVVADANRNGVDDFKDGLDFNDPENSVFEAYKPNAPILGYSAEGGYTMRIGDVTYRVFFAWGGNGLYKQRYVTRIPVTDRPTLKSAGTYIMPLQYNEKTHQWVPYHPDNWYEADGSPIFGLDTTSSLAATRGRSFDKKCSGCHFTGITVKQDALGEWVSLPGPVILFDPNDPTTFDYDDDGVREETDVGCESCHGPGSQHIMNLGAPGLIINPERDFNTKQANELCGSCHTRGSSSAGTFGFPWDEVEDHGYIPGDDINKYLTSGVGLWPDGKHSKKHHQQWFDFMGSSKPTFQFHEVKCFECHDLHSAGKHSIRAFIDEETDAGGTIRIPTENDDNTLCLACHATHGPFTDISKEMVADYDNNVPAIAGIVSAHTHHPYAPDRKLGLSRCSKCHMPKIAKSAINYDIHSHTFEAIPPEKTLMYQAEGGMPNSCSVSCHRNIVNIFPNGPDGDIGNWTEQSDKDLADWLMNYFGPNGKWWKTGEPNNQ